MWETLVKPPRGRISARKFTVLLITLVVACFTYVVAMAPTTYAADAEWNEDGTGIVYNGRTYTNPQTVTDTGVINLPEGSTYLTSIDRSVTPNRAFVIYFTSGTSPPSASRATAVTFTLDGDNYTNRSATTAITIVPQSGTTAEGSTSCATEDTPGLSWLICPLTNTLAKAMDYIYGIVSGYLEVRPLATTADQPMYRAWEYMRNIANVAFVISFMVVIYSQVTSIGLNNYSIKKLLPRVIIAALLVNVSYWICAIAIDIFNVLGYSVQDLFISVRNSLVGAEGNSWDVISWESMASFVLSGGAVAGGIGIGAYLGITSLTVGVAGAGAATGLIFLLLPMLLSVLFVVLMTFLILAARQAIITILVVLAPLAFVAYLLPNTEEWFTKWRKALFTLLLLFPAFSLVFAGAQLAAALIIQNATDLNMILLAMGVQVAPLAITPLLLKLGGGILNRFAGIVNNPTKGVFDRGKNWARERSAQHAAAGHAKIAADRARARNLGVKGFVNEKGKRRSGKFVTGMAYRREYGRREREGMKTANEAMADGYFTQTAAASRIGDRTKDAHLEKEAGEAANLRRYNTTMATGSDAQSVYRRGLHHQAHVDKGVGGLYETSLNNHAERDLKTQINNNSQLRGVQIRSDVDAAHADFQAKSVTADGKLAFSQEVMASRGLRMMNRDRVAAEKEAGSLDNTLQKRAEAHWDRQSSHDQRVQNIRLQEVSATDSAKLAEAQWNTIVSGINADGAKAAGYTGDANLANSIQKQFERTVAVENASESLGTIAKSHAEKAYIQSTEGRRMSLSTMAAKDSLEGIRTEEAALAQEYKTEEGVQKYGLTGDDLRIAQELRDADIQKRVQGARQHNAEGVGTIEYVTAVKDDASGLADIAGGIDKYGAQRAKSSAFETMVGNWSKNVDSEKTTMSRLNDAELYDIVTDKNQSSERRAAATGMIAKGSGMKMIHKLFDTITQPVPDDDPDEREIIRDLQQQFKGDVGARMPFAVGATDAARLGRGELGQKVQSYTAEGIPETNPDGTQKMVRRATLDEMFASRAQEKLSGAQWASLDPDDRARYISLASTEAGRELLESKGQASLLRAFNDARDNPTVNIKDEAKIDANIIATAFGEDLPFPDLPSSR